MNFKHEETKETGCVIKYRITMEKDEVTKEKGRVINNLISTAKLPGFRPGKIPREVFEKRFIDRINQTMLESIIPTVYKELVENLKIKVYQGPEFSDIDFKNDSDMKFTIKIETFPEVNLSNYKNVVVKKNKYKIDRKDIDAEIENLKKENMQLKNKSKDKNSVEDGNAIFVDIVTTENGNDVKEGNLKNFLMIMDKDKMPPGFYEQVLKMKKNDEKEIEILYPKSYKIENLKTRKFVCQVKINDIQDIIIPNLDDEFAKDVGDYKTLKELRDSIDKRLDDISEQYSINISKRELLDSVVKSTKFDIPKTMIDMEVKNNINNFKRKYINSGISFEEFAESRGMNEEQMKKDITQSSIKSISEYLLLRKISELENIQIDDSAVDNEIKNYADGNNMKVTDIIEQMKKSGNYEMIRDRLKNDKALQFLFDNATIKKGAVHKFSEIYNRPDNNDNFSNVLNMSKAES